MKTKEEITSEFETIKLEIEELKQELLKNFNIDSQEDLEAKREALRFLVKEAAESLTLQVQISDWNTFKDAVEEIFLEELGPRTLYPELDKLPKILNGEDFIKFRNLMLLKLGYYPAEVRSKVKNRIAKVREELVNA